MRSLDIGISAIVLVVGGIPLALGAAAIRLTSAGPALYRSMRAGLDGEPFALLKLRTMRTGAPGQPITGPEDRRITPVGRVLRRLKIDELPQFWNVLTGDMSIVGPRPEDVSIVAQHYSAEELRLLAVRPGITSRVQIEWYPDVMYHVPPPEGTGVMDYYIDRVLHPKLTLELRALEGRGLGEYVRIVGRTASTLVRWSVARPPRRQWPEEFQ